ncbi:hypothetical protein [Larsenimonas rhizosphaerae]|uniref:Uncharacterized protein n=1 Tax=Larsenimonas rhizosphaerae TaxID=2944682 RepID=A0AA42CYS4_9GAMM|nr:hypothetical protein [Larsenimonas rhizosphaerae]MCX2525500.1 hypothetical protein [Larsenimonas rhizosphaerae]
MSATHWHLLPWMKPEELDTVNDVLKACTLADSPDEPGAPHRRHLSTMAISSDYQAGPL